MQRAGTTVDGQPIPPNKPTQLRSGSVLAFGSCPKTFKLQCSSSKGPPARAAASPSAAAAAGPSRVRASHLLVKHRGSRRPSSWKEEVVTRSQEEALGQIQAFREQLVAGTVDFATLASRESHCGRWVVGGWAGRQAAMGTWSVPPCHTVLTAIPACLTPSCLPHPSLPHPLLLLQRQARGRPWGVWAGGDAAAV